MPGCFGCRKSGLRHFFEVFIAPLRLRRGQGAMQGNPCYARLFADLTRMSPNPIKASGGCGPRTPGGFSTGCFVVFTKKMVRVFRQPNHKAQNKNRIAKGKAALFSQGKHIQEGTGTCKKGMRHRGLSPAPQLRAPRGISQGDRGREPDSHHPPASVPGADPHGGRFLLSNQGERASTMDSPLQYSPPSVGNGIRFRGSSWILWP